MRQARFVVVTERDIDLLLLEELTVSERFGAWFYAHVTESSEAPRVTDVWHSVSVAGHGESDLVALFDNGVAVLIENKIDAVAQREQGARYRARGAHGIEAGYWRAFKTCMVAPAAYLEHEPDAKSYDAQLSYEALADWFAAQSDARSAYKVQVLKEGIEQNRMGYKMTPDESVTAFWQRYWQFATKHYPVLKMQKPGAKGPKSDWPQFKPTHYSIIHKLKKGAVELSLKLPVHQRDSLQALVKAGGVEVTDVGGFAVLCIEVAAVDCNAAFETQVRQVEAGLAAAARLVVLEKELLPALKALEESSSATRRQALASTPD